MFIKDNIITQLKSHANTHFVYIFIALASLSSCLFFKCLQKMLVHCTNTKMETRSLFVDSSVDNVLLQTNTDLTNQSLFNSLTAQTHCCKTVKLCNWLAARSHRSGEVFIKVFFLF